MSEWYLLGATVFSHGLVWVWGYAAVRRATNRLERAERRYLALSATLFNPPKK